mmetsp:Transcript_84664/g.141123  ORF Transcript_84664/g.141123 Transcript_84664/m.141123 type:complete len:237 (-) Transcript_84664:253-963(-)
MGRGFVHFLSPGAPMGHDQHLELCVSKREAPGEAEYFAGQQIARGLALTGFQLIHDHVLRVVPPGLLFRLEIHKIRVVLLLCFLFGRLLLRGLLRGLRCGGLPLFRIAGVVRAGRGVHFSGLCHHCPMRVTEANFLVTPPGPRFEAAADASKCQAARDHSPQNHGNRRWYVCGWGCNPRKLCVCPERAVLLRSPGGTGVMLHGRVEATATVCRALRRRSGKTERVGAYLCCPAECC